MPMSVQLRAAILLRCLEQGREISGNTDSGRDYYRREEKGIRTENGTVLTGSGPASWSHDGTPAGIWDLVGNLHEWDVGYRLLDGEIQLMSPEALTDPDCDYGKSSPLWTALDREGKPVTSVRQLEPGDRIRLQMKDGLAECKVEKREEQSLGTQKTLL